MRKPEKRGIKLLALTQIKPPYCIEQSTVASFTSKYQHAFSNLVQTDNNKNKMKQLIYITILKPVLVTLVDHQQHLSPAGRLTWVSGAMGGWREKSVVAFRV